jgi:hypothetical protein
VTPEAAVLFVASKVDFVSTGRIGWTFPQDRIAMGSGRAGAWQCPH